MLKRLLITGYKGQELGIFKQDHPGVQIIKLAMEKKIRPMLEDGVLEWVIISGNLGVEIWAAELVQELQMEYPELQLAIIPAFMNQEEKWKEETKEHYLMILEGADFVDYVFKRPYESPQQFKARNQFLVHKTDGMLLVYDEENEGSPKYMKEEAEKKAAREEYPIIMISSYDLQEVAEEIQENTRDDW